jgi:uncharacterized protein
MAKKMFTNLPVKDLPASIDFFTKLGFTFNPQFSDKNGTCMIAGDDAFVMLLAEDFFKTFTKKELADATTTTEVITAITVDSREEVDTMVDAALTAGATPSNEASEQEFMYTRSFQDLDGHLWEVLYMDSAAMNQQ